MSKKKATSKTTEVDPNSNNTVTMSFSIPLRLAQILKASPNRSKLVVESLEKQLVFMELGYAVESKRSFAENMRRTREIFKKEGITITTEEVLRLKGIGRA